MQNFAANLGEIAILGVGVSLLLAWINHLKPLRGELQPPTAMQSFASHSKENSLGQR
jgi:hypothetical protein